MIKLGAGTPGGRWQQTTLNPPAGTDLLLPALGLLSPGAVRLLCAVHTRLGDRLGYDVAGITVTGQRLAVALCCAAAAGALFLRRRRTGTARPGRAGRAGPAGPAGPAAEAAPGWRPRRGGLAE